MLIDPFNNHRSALVRRAARIMVDNLKSAVLKRAIGEAPVLNALRRLRAPPWL